MLSTPPAFILSQDQTLILKVVLQNSLSLFFRFTSFDVYCCLGAIFLRIATVFRLCSFWIILSNLSRLSHCSVINVLCCRLADSLFIISNFLLFVKNFFIYFSQVLAVPLSGTFYILSSLASLVNNFFISFCWLFFCLLSIFQWSTPSCRLLFLMFCWHVLRSASIYYHLRYAMSTLFFILYLINQPLFISFYSDTLHLVFEVLFIHYIFFISYFLTNLFFIHFNFFCINLHP